MAEQNTITLEYDLFNLPTAQHKAGLAGLILLVHTMREREMSPLPEIVVGQTQCSVTWTKESMQAVFNEWYAPITLEIGKKKEMKVFPKGDFLKWLLPDEAGIWLKLWRDMVWGVLRTRAFARDIFKRCLEEKDSTVASFFWTEIQKNLDSERKILGTVKLSSSLFISAQEVNSEGVPFTGTPSEVLLLHFWQLPSLIFSPRFIVKEKNEFKFENKGFLIVIPDPSNLEQFLEETIDLIKRLDPTPSGYRPQLALIDLPVEGGVEYLFQLAHSKINREYDLVDSLKAVEIYHLDKSGNNVQMLTFERIDMQRNLLTKYKNIRGQVFNPLFKKLRLQNLLANKDWFEGGDSLFNQYPWEFFIQSENTPRILSPFGLDVGKTFKDFQPKEERPMPESNQADRLAMCIQRLIKNYVRRKSVDKSGIKYESIPRNDKGFPNYPPPYREAVEKVASDAFLAMRSRREQDFIEYFTSQICSVPQGLSEDDFLLVTQTLLNDPDRVKTISMMALSAASALPKNTAEREEGE